MTHLNILDYDLSELEALLKNKGEKPYRALQVFKWIHQNGHTDFSAMTNLSVALRDWLQQNFTIHSPRVDKEIIALDGTIRWVLKLNCLNSIETVFIPEANRGTLCVSSQAGCAVNCGFCQTAVGGFNRNLSTGEIVGQLHFAINRLKEIDSSNKITNVVMMGMGEPLLNFDNVVKATNVMLDDNAYGLSKYRVTVSTVGIIPKMKLLSQISPVSLTVSLHAATDELRTKIMPINKKYPLDELMEVCRTYFPRHSKRKITFAYLMLKGVNDSINDAKKLVKIISNVSAKVNLIPFNTFPEANFCSSEDATILEFRNFLLSKNIQTTVRKTRGEDVYAACGQLVGAVMKRKPRKLYNSIDH